MDERMEERRGGGGGGETEIESSPTDTANCTVATDREILNRSVNYYRSFRKSD